MPFVVVLLSALLMIHLLTREVVETQEYADYAQTTITQGNERLRDNVIGGVIGSVEQAGILGYGLGTATQGRYHAAQTIMGESGKIKAWQEDGISRIFAEMGVFGAILVMMALVNGLKACRWALKMVPPHNRIAELQMGLAGVVTASAASFVISHQAFSGDPCSMLFVTFLLGVMLSGPLQALRETIALQQEHETSFEQKRRGSVSSIRIGRGRIRVSHRSLAMSSSRATPAEAQHVAIACHAWYEDDFGGSFRLASEFAEYLASRGHKVTFVCCGFPKTNSSLAASRKWSAKRRRQTLSPSKRMDAADRAPAISHSSNGPLYQRGHRGAENRRALRPHSAAVSWGCPAASTCGFQDISRAFAPRR